MNLEEMLPIGSVVLVKEGTKKLMIIGVKQSKPVDGSEWDYLGVFYPEGHVGPEGLFMFQHEDISEVFCRGYENEERTNFVKLLNEYYENEAEKSEIL